MFTGAADGHLWPCAAPSLVPVWLQFPSEKPAPFPRNRLCERAMGLQSYSPLIVAVKRETPYVVSPAMTGLMLG
jgi:hypothetical protein